MHATVGGCRPVAVAPVFERDFGVGGCVGGTVANPATNGADFIFDIRKSSALDINYFTLSAHREENMVETFGGVALIDERSLHATVGGCRPVAVASSATVKTWTINEASPYQIASMTDYYNLIPTRSDQVDFGIKFAYGVLYCDGATDTAT